MRNKMWVLTFVCAFFVKFLLSLIIGKIMYVSIYCLSFVFVYSFMIYKRAKIISFIPFIMIDFIINFLLIVFTYNDSSNVILLGMLHFIFANSLIYYLLIYRLAKDTSKKKLTRISNEEIDKGIKALENKEYNIAIEAFTNAIKEHKENYLGYMGLCNTLKSMDHTNLKKLDYYKKKCIKYAPKELKDTIKQRY